MICLTPISARSRRTVLSAKARIDLSDLLLFAERRWGRTQRREYQKVLSEAFSKLAVFPFMGQFRPDFGPEYHGLRVGQHVIVYRVTKTEIQIDRLLHVRRDADAETESAQD